MPSLKYAYAKGKPNPQKPPPEFLDREQVFPRTYDELRQNKIRQLLHKLVYAAILTPIDEEEDEE